MDKKEHKLVWESWKICFRFRNNKIINRWELGIEQGIIEFKGERWKNNIFEQIIRED
jgi:hypothetical protein